MYELEIVKKNLDTLLNIHANQYCSDYQKLEREIVELAGEVERLEALGITTHKNGFDYNRYEMKRYFREGYLIAFDCEECTDAFTLEYFSESNSVCNRCIAREQKLTQ